VGSCFAVRICRARVRGSGWRIERTFVLRMMCRMSLVLYLVEILVKEWTRNAAGQGQSDIARSEEGASERFSRSLRPC